jgi:hemerythrin superfamily protein
MYIFILNIASTQARSQVVKKKTLKSKNHAKPTKRTKKQSVGLKSDSKSGEITSLILRDHKPIKELILILKDPEVSFSKKQPAFSEFEQVLTHHAKAEEESLYVHLKHEDDLRIEGLEGDTEHAIAMQLIEEIKDSRDDEDTWMAKVKVLAEIVDHHVKEEEKSVLKQVKKEFSNDMRVEIGEMYSKLLKKYREENDKPRKYNSKDEMRAEHV